MFKGGGGNWGTLRIPREDWGTLGKIREPPPWNPPLSNPIITPLGNRKLQDSPKKFRVSPTRGSGFL